MSQLFIYLPQFFYYLSVVMYKGPFFFIFILGHCIYVNSFYDLSFHTFFPLYVFLILHSIILLPHL